MCKKRQTYLGSCIMNYSPHPAPTLFSFSHSFSLSYLISPAWATESKHCLCKTVQNKVFCILELMRPGDSVHSPISIPIPKTKLIQEMSLLFIISYSTAFSFTASKRASSWYRSTFCYLRGTFPVCPDCYLQISQRLWLSSSDKTTDQPPDTSLCILSAHTYCF